MKNDELLNELKEMESLQIDMDNEGKILQNDIIDFLLNGKWKFGRFGRQN